MADHLKMHTKNIAAENFAKLATLFPNAVTETITGYDERGEAIIERAIDKDILMQEINCKVVEGREERYQFTWPDKKKAILAANMPINKTLRPCREESVNFDSTENLYIEGDNLEVLKLLQETYLGKIKLIYIDPPYNTGNDFVYNDDFRVESGEWRAESGNYDADGNLLVDNYTRNTESNGRFHTDWLNMIYPRLKLARDLLSDDGVIFISIDDNEVENLKKICSEVFGESNQIGLITLQSNPRGSQNSKNLSYIHEYLLVYAKNEDFLELKGIEKSEESLSEFSEIDERGKKYRLLGLRKRGGAWKKEDRPLMHYPIFVNPNNGKVSLEKTDEYFIEVIPKKPTGELGRWCWGKSKFIDEKDKLVGKKINRKGEQNVYDIFKKDYMEDESGEVKTTKVKTIWIEKETNYQNAKNEIKELFGNSEVFDFPKPIYIVEKLLAMFYSKDDIILDFFSGSSTTAHAVLKANANDGGKRMFIMVQIPERIPEKHEAKKLGFETIPDIAKERIRRAGAQMLKQVQGDKGKNQCDTSCHAELACCHAELVSASQSNETLKQVQGDSAQVQGDKGKNQGDKEKACHSEQREESHSQISVDVSATPQHDTLATSTNNPVPTTSNNLDIGFRVLKLDSSNMEDVYYSPEDLAGQDLFKSNIKSDRSAEDLLFQVMLDLGIMLSSKIDTKQIDGKTVYYVAGNYLAACFAENVTEETIAKIAKEKPYYFVMKDSSMANDRVATNFEQIFATYSPETIRRVL